MYISESNGEELRNAMRQNTFPEGNTFISNQSGSSSRKNGEGSAMLTSPINTHQYSTSSSQASKKTKNLGRSKITDTEICNIFPLKKSSLGDQKDASKPRRKIDDIDKDAEIT
ncbi:hypothetical protein Tco_1371430 [Tanacetum coccineum]